MTAGTVSALYLATALIAGGLGAAGVVAHLAKWPIAERGPLWRVFAIGLTALVVAVWIARWAIAGHIPIFGTFESALSLAAFTSATSLWWEWRSGFRSISGPAAALIVAAILGHGYAYDHTIYALTISERSWLVDLHAIVAWAAFGVLATNAALSLRAVVGGAPGRQLSGWIAHTLELGFVLHTAMLITGAAYRFILFGKAWSFDPIETMGLAAWLAYGTLVHMVRFAHWDGRRLARWSLFLFVVLLVSYRVIVYYPSWTTYHIFDVDLRMHLV